MLDGINLRRTIEMKVSIVTVCYNSESTIRKTIESVLNQEYDEVEYIIIDGGSVDGTLDIIKEYNDKIAYWCSEKDHGIYDAMNKGIRVSKGDIIAFMNSDDWYYDSSVFQKVIACFEESNADIVYGDCIILYGNVDKKYVYFTAEDKKLEALYFTLPFCHQSIFMRRSMFDVLGVYNINYKVAADYEWILRAYISNAKFQYISECICCFRAGGYSCKSQIAAAEELRNISLSMLPKAKRELYYDNILQTYENKKINSIIYGVLMDDEQTIKIAKECLKKYDKKIILLGAGMRGNRMKIILGKIGVHVIAFMDNNKNKWGTSIEGIKVEKPYFISDDNAKIILTMSGYHNEVKEQLIKLGYNEINIFTEAEFLKEIYEKVYS